MVVLKIILLRNTLLVNSSASFLSALRYTLLFHRKEAMLMFSLVFESDLTT